MLIAPPLRTWLHTLAKIPLPPLPLLFLSLLCLPYSTPLCLTFFSLLSLLSLYPYHPCSHTTMRAISSDPLSLSQYLIGNGNTTKRKRACGSEGHLRANQVRGGTYGGGARQDRMLMAADVA